VADLDRLFDPLFSAALLTQSSFARLRQSLGFTGSLSAPTLAPAPGTTITVVEPSPSAAPHKPGTAGKLDKPTASAQPPVSPSTSGGGAAKPGAQPPRSTRNAPPAPLPDESQNPLSFLHGRDVVLIVDPLLFELPLEALPVFSTARTVTRDFSLHMLYQRVRNRALCSS
jgi:hypothetical protein